MSSIYFFAVRTVLYHLQIGAKVAAIQGGGLTDKIFYTIIL